MTVPNPADIDAALAAFEPLCDLGPADRASLAETGELLEVKRGKYLFQQGDTDNFSYFLINGEIDLVAGGELVYSLRGGETKARHALAQLQPRQMSARARNTVTVFRCDRDALDDLLRRRADSIIGGVEVSEFEGEGDDGDWMARLLRSPIFERVPAANMQRIFTSLQSVDAAAGEVIISQGSAGDFYYIIQSGTCEVARSTAAGGARVRLAVLNPGDTFGEEALVAGARRNASVTMLTDGELLRLARADFLELICKPMLQLLDQEAAASEVAAGAQWLDVRFIDEFAGSARPDTINLPLNLLRVRAATLDPSRRYIACCDNGQRSAVAAFLLAERGFDVACLDGGLANVRAPAQAGVAELLPFPPPRSHTEPAGEDVAGQRVEAEVRSQALRAELSRANEELNQAVQARQAADAGRAAAEREAERRIQRTTKVAVAEAERLKAEMARAREEAAQEAERIRREAEAEAAARYEKERQRLEAESRKAAEVRAEAERLREEAAAEANARYEQERQRLEAEGRKAAEAMARAEQLKAEVEKSRAQAEAEAQRRRAEQEAEIDALRKETEGRLLEEKRKLEQAYRWRNEEVARLKELRRKAEAQIKAERARLKAEQQAAQQRLGEARRIEQEVEQTRRAAIAEAERRQKRQLELEQRLREELDSKIDTERRRLEAEMARNAEQLALAQREREAAEAASRAAHDEAQHIIAEYREAFERNRAEEQAKLDAEKQRLEAEAARLQQTMDQAQAARVEAEVARNAAVTALAESAATGVEHVRLEEDVRAAEAELSQAAAELEAAEAAQAVNEVAIETNEASTHALSDQLEAELEQWLRDQQAWEESETQAQILANQREHMERIRQRAQQAREHARQHDQSLIEELRGKLGRPEEDL